MKRVSGLPAVVLLIAATLALLGGCARADLAGNEIYHAEIRRTQQGIPHIEAADWGSLGYGYGYVQAQDNLCTLADAFVTYRGERSANFGPDERPPTAASFGQPRNLDADFFFRLVDDQTVIEHYRSAQTLPLHQLIDGFAAGYNRYLGELQAGHFPSAHLACNGKPWVTRISADDIYRRLVAANLAGGATRFVPQIAQAQPPVTLAAPVAHASAGLPMPVQSIADEAAGDISGSPAEIKLTAAQLEMGGRAGIGSNALAFGAKVTHDGASMLFGNPHWFWRGPDRFYEAQLTIPGKLNVAGVSFLGVPLVMMGFNDNIAWTHTVSAARRFGLFQLTLDPTDPTRYLYDGRSVAMDAVPVTVQIRRADGTLQPVTRTLYRSRFGPLLDLASLSPALAWNAQHAFALHDINMDNTRAFENFLAWDQAVSLDDFMAIQKRLAATPWVNTFAVGRADPRVWFADIGAIPDVPDALAQNCTPPLGRAFDAQMPGVPFLDGSRSDCNWGNPARAPQPEGLPVAQMPALLRDDYVGNFNGSYWLTNATAPLTGYPTITGITGTQQSLRTRLGHELAAELQREPGGVTRGSLKRAVLDSRSMSEALMRQPILAALCADPATGVGTTNAAANWLVTLSPAEAKIPHAGFATASSNPQTVDLREACKVLHEWNGKANIDARGANLWDEFWRRANDLPDARLYRVPFDPAHPLTTPQGLNAGDPTVVEALRQALGQAVVALQKQGFKLDSTRGEMLYTQRDGKRIPLYGGCDAEGYFTVVCSQHMLDADGYSMDHNGHGESYVQLVSFGAHGVEADTLLAHSESDDPVSPHFADATRQFSNQSWLRFPFSEQAIAGDPELTRIRLEGR